MNNKPGSIYTGECIWNVVVNLQYSEEERLVHRQGVWSYSSFESARENYSKAIRRYADNKTEGFTFLEDFQKYLGSLSPEWFLHEDDQNCIELLPLKSYEKTAEAFEKARKIPNQIRDLIIKWEIRPEPEEYCCFTDDMMAVCFEKEVIEIKEDYDGPANGVNPHLLINFFALEDPEKEYVFQIGGGFSHEELEKHFSCSVNLVKNTVNEPF